VTTATRDEQAVSKTNIMATAATATTIDATMFWTLTGVTLTLQPSRSAPRSRDFKEG